MKKKIKIVTIFGTRPECIKMAPVIKEMEKFKDRIDSVVLITSQHKQMLKQELGVFKILPNYDLSIMKTNQTLENILTSSLNKISKILSIVRPDLVLVQGDTLTTFAGCLSAFYSKIKIGYVESGLRTFDKLRPFPEEANRRTISILADLHFAPTMQNKINLLNEQISEKSIFLTGNTVIDAFKFTVRDNYVFKNPVLKKLDYNNKKIIIVTAHRRENWGFGLKNIFNCIKKISKEFSDVQIVYPVHLNPMIRKQAYEILGNLQEVYLTNPIVSEDMHNLISRCYFVMTDSGGLQEEAPTFGKPVLVLRNETERVEGVNAGVARICGTFEEEIFQHAKKLLNDKEEYEKMSKTINPYGDGHASERIVKIITEHFS